MGAGLVVGVGKWFEKGTNLSGVFFKEKTVDASCEKKGQGKRGEGGGGVE